MEKYFDPFRNDKYLKRVDAIKMKRFYGKVPPNQRPDFDCSVDQGTFGMRDLGPL